MRDSTSETHTHAHKEDQKQAVEASGKLRYRDSCDSRRPMLGKAHAGKKKSYAHSYVQYMCTCVRAYMLTCVRTYVRIYAYEYAYEYAYDVFPREPSHAEIFTSRCDTVTRRGTVVCRMYVRTWHVPICACTHI